MLSFTAEAQNTKAILHLALWNIRKSNCLESKKFEKHLQLEHHTDKKFPHSSKIFIENSALLPQAMSVTILS
jgi:hypothetical protein